MSNFFQTKNIFNIRNKIAILCWAIIMSSLFFMLLPIMYSFSRKKIHTLLETNISKTHQIHATKVKKKKQQIPKEKKLKKIEHLMQRSKTLSANRFQLDMSLAGGRGNGALINGNENKLIYREGQVDIPPIRRKAIMPVYPVQAKQEGIETSVQLELLINEFGKVSKVRIIKCLPNWGFEHSIINAVLKWEFSPARIKQLPVRMWAILTIDFKL